MSLQELDPSFAERPPVEVLRTMLSSIGEGEGGEEEPGAGGGSDGGDAGGPSEQARELAHDFFEEAEERRTGQRPPWRQQ